MWKKTQTHTQRQPRTNRDEKKTQQRWKWNRNTQQLTTLSHIIACERILLRTTTTTTTTIPKRYNSMALLIFGLKKVFVGQLVVFDGFLVLLLLFLFFVFLIFFSFSFWLKQCYCYCCQFSRLLSVRLYYDCWLHYTCSATIILIFFSGFFAYFITKYFCCWFAAFYRTNVIATKFLSLSPKIIYRRKNTKIYAIKMLFFMRLFALDLHKKIR